MSNNCFNKKNKRAMLIGILASLSTIGNSVRAQGNSVYPMMGTMQYSANVVPQQTQPIYSQIPPQQNNNNGNSIKQVLVTEEVTKNMKQRRKNSVLGKGDLIFEAANIGGNGLWYLSMSGTRNECDKILRACGDYCTNPFCISDYDDTKNETKTLAEWGIEMTDIGNAMNAILNGKSKYWMNYLMSYTQKDNPLSGLLIKRANLVVENNTDDSLKEPDDSRTKIGQPDPFTGQPMQEDDYVLISKFHPDRLKTMPITKLQSEFLKNPYGTAEKYGSEFVHVAADPLFLAVSLAVGHVLTVPFRAMWHVGSNIGNTIGDVAMLRASK